MRKGTDFYSLGELNTLGVSPCHIMSCSTALQLCIWQILNLSWSFTPWNSWAITADFCTVSWSHHVSVLKNTSVAWGLLLFTPPASFVWEVFPSLRLHSSPHLCINSSVYPPLRSINTPCWFLSHEGLLRSIEGHGIICSYWVSWANNALGLQFAVLAFYSGIEWNKSKFLM